VFRGIVLKEAPMTNKVKIDIALAVNAYCCMAIAHTGLQAKPADDKKVGTLLRHKTPKIVVDESF